MANKTIQVKRAYAESWNTKLANFILAAGEIGLEKDTGRIKFGDGVSTWSELSYSDSTEIVDDLDIITNKNQETYANKAASAKVVKNIDKRVQSIENITGIDGGVIE